MILFVNAKINLGLQVVARRPDGYHELSTIFYPIGVASGTPYSPFPFGDILEINRISDSGECRFSFSGNNIDCPLEKNLVYKAAIAFRSAFSEKTGEEMPAFDIRLEKHIPDGAGLGGGSADASFVLKTLNDLTGNHLSDAELITIAARIGADCPFFIVNTPCLAKGIGEVLTPVELSLAGKWLLIVKPELSIPTKEAFAGVDCGRPHADTLALLTLSIEEWRGAVENEFEPHIFEAHPELAAIKQSLYDSGAVYAQMSGSGSALFGIFETEPDLSTLTFPGCRLYLIRL